MKLKSKLNKKNMLYFSIFFCILFFTILFFSVNREGNNVSLFYDSSLDFYFELQSGQYRSNLYMISIVIFLPILMINDYVQYKYYKFDKNIVIRIGRKIFFTSSIKHVFLKGMLFGVILNLLVFTFIVFIIPSNSIISFSTVTNPYVFFENSNEIINFILYIIFQGVGFGLLNITLFFLTRIVNNRYFSYLSVLFIILLLTTFISVIGQGLLNIPFLIAPLKFIVSLIDFINPLSIILPFYVGFDVITSVLIKYLISVLIYLIINFLLFKFVLNYEERNG